MTIPVVGPVTALACKTSVEDPTRFRRSRPVGAHFGPTPRRFQSGTVDYSGRISRTGDPEMHCLLYSAASSSSVNGLADRRQAGCWLAARGLRVECKEMAQRLIDARQSPHQAKASRGRVSCWDLHVLLSILAGRPMRRGRIHWCRPVALSRTRPCRRGGPYIACGRHRRITPDCLSCCPVKPMTSCAATVQVPHPCSEHARSMRGGLRSAASPRVPAGRSALEWKFARFTATGRSRRWTEPGEY